MVRVSNEIRNYIEKYMTGENKWMFPTDSSVDYLNFIKLVGRCEPFEAPDLFRFDNDTVLIVEHFRFDSSKAKRNKGSDEKRQEAANLREVDKHLNDTQNGEIVSGSFYSRRKSEYYLQNLERAFDEHYSKIEQYKINVCKELNLQIERIRFIVAFIIEDSTSFGNVCLYGEPKAILPINVMEFLDYCSQKNEVDFYICSSETFGNNGTITYVLSRYDIENAKNKSVPILGKELVDLEINTISGNIFIPFSK